MIRYSFNRCPHQSKHQLEEWVCNRYGWSKTKAKNTSKAKLVFVWYNPQIDWHN